MTESIEKPLGLTTCLADHQDEVATTWAEMVRQLPGSHYRARPLQEILEQTQRGLKAIISALSTGSNDPLENHVAEIGLLRFPLGFDIDEVIQGLLLCVEAALPFMLKAFAPDDPETSAAILQFDARVRYMVGRFGQLYAQAQQRDLAYQQKRTALILEATQATGVSPEIGQVLKHIASGLAAAVGLSDCGIYLLDREKGILVPRDGITAERSGYLDGFRRLDLDPAQEPFIRELIERQQPVTSFDVQADPRISGETARALGVKSLLAVPIVVGSRFLGAAIVSTFEDHRAFTAEEIELATGIANAVALVIDNVQLYEETRLHLAESESLRRVSSALLQKRSLGEILEIVCAEAQQLTGATGSTVFLLEDDGTLRVAFTTGVASPVSDRIPLAGSLTGVAISKGEPVLANNPAPQTVTYRGHPETTALLAIPLRVKDVSIGSMDVVNKPGGFLQRDVRIMSLFAAQAAIAIDHARLSQQAEELAVLQERQRLARELHDSVTQSIYSIKLYAEAAIKLLKAGNATVAAEHLGELRETADEALNDMRLLVFELQPRWLEKEGLAVAIQARLDAVEKRTGVHTEFKVEGEGELPLTVTEELYHIAQEALNNVLKHAQAQRVQVHLQLDEKTARLEVYDDGVGFVPATGKGKGRPGLRGMQERAERIGAALKIDSSPGQGTHVRVVANI
jgi:signal transduction histidine kinase